MTTLMYVYTQIKTMSLMYICIYIQIYRYRGFYIYSHKYLHPSVSSGPRSNDIHSSGEHTKFPGLGFQTPFSTKVNLRASWRSAGSRDVAEKGQDESETSCARE